MCKNNKKRVILARDSQSFSQFGTFHNKFADRWVVHYMIRNPVLHSPKPHIFHRAILDSVLFTNSIRQQVQFTTNFAKSDFNQGQACNVTAFSIFLNTKYSLIEKHLFLDCFFVYFSVLESVQ